MAQKIENLYSPNFSPKKRNIRNIKYLIIHYTGMNKTLDAIKRLINYKSEVSCHYFIKKNGDIIRMVPDSYISWHAGKSKWKKHNFLNKLSLGIELDNPGHDYGYQPFKLKQIKSLKSLIKKLKSKYKIKKENVLGHSDIAPKRKKDPGEKFPWHLLAKNKLCLWPDLKLKNLKKFRRQKLNKKDKDKFIKIIYKIGYCKIAKLSEKKSTKYLIMAFQRRFRNELVDGNIDFECFLISKNLANN
jgi:N-acetylmuramoyl-L-alanine amidase